ncbi:hypothetical protein CLIB1423_06S05754 [[Candida] railenensis]|uniref:Uncharacterized protein n=1 Tax=[Candida] railenensis TaxID=45579 RepID=A0A9P0QPV1_9ASCO|nr:hypothetical protein CLIB1423_06S05754 [[Candida] railenensis]
MNVKSLVSLFECEESTGKVDMKVLVSPRPYIEKLIIKTPSRNNVEEHMISKRMREIRTENTSPIENVRGRDETELSIDLRRESKNYTLNETNDLTERSEDTDGEIGEQCGQTINNVTGIAKSMSGSDSGSGLFVLNHNLQLEEPIKSSSPKILESPLETSVEPSVPETSENLNIQIPTNPTISDAPIDESILEDAIDENNSNDSYSVSLFDDYLANIEQGKSATKSRMAANGAEQEIRQKKDDLDIQGQGATDDEPREEEDKGEEKEEKKEKEEEAEEAERDNSYFSTPPAVSKDMFITPPESPVGSNCSSITSPGSIYKINVKERYSRVSSLKPGFNYELPKLNPIPESKSIPISNPLSSSTLSCASSPSRPLSTPPRIYTRDFQRKRIIRMEDTIDDGDGYSDMYSNIFKTPVKKSAEPSASMGMPKVVPRVMPHLMTKTSSYNEKSHWFNRNPFKKRKERDFHLSIPRKLVISEPQNVRDIAFEAYSKRIGVTQVHPVVKLLNTGPKKVDRAVQTEPLKVSTAFEMTRCSIQRLRENQRESRAEYESKKQQWDPTAFKKEAFGEYVDMIFNL